MFLDDLLQAGIFFILVLATGQLFVRGRSKANTLFFALSCVCSFWIAHAFFYRLGLIDKYPHWNKLHVPFLCITGPLWFLYSKALTADIAWRPAYWRHGMPVLICYLLSIPFYLQSAEYKQSHFEANVYDFPGATMYLATRIAELTVIGYLAGSVLHWSAVRRQINAADEQPALVTVSYVQASSGLPLTYVMQALSAVCLLAACVRLLGSVFGERGYSVYSVLIPCLLIVAVAVAYFILSCRYPALLNISHTLSEPHRRAAERVCSDADIAELNGYRRQIRSGQWYLDPDLKLLKVARKIGIPTKRLSELINTVSDTNFNGFINQMRIEHAKNLLVKQHSLSILEVAENSGFNSKSVFYKQFSHFESCSPNSYRKQHSSSAVTDSIA